MTPAQLATIRARGWNLEAHPDTIDELREATIEGLHRIDASEVEWANDDDLFGIWEVVRNVRSSGCDNTRFSSGARIHITQCQTTSGAVVDVEPGDTVPDAQETHLSSMRRLSRYVMGIGRSTARGRLRWTRNVNLACDEPEGFPERRHWEGLRDQCLAHAALIRQLVEGTLRRDITGRARAIAWGGRCGRPGYACDDPGACRRGLAGILNTETANRFWCRPGGRGCTPWVEREGTLYSDQLCASIRVPPKRRPIQRRIGRTEPWVDPGRVIPATTERVVQPEPETAPGPLATL